ncbi:hypothetical protein [Enterobacter phage 01_vB_Eclo_IJM]|nr:hypothetical protein [Enterobacter phage 01_vB_Eclo_IJM]
MTARQSSGPSQRLELQHQRVSRTGPGCSGQSDSLATVLPQGHDHWGHKLLQ